MEDRAYKSPLGDLAFEDRVKLPATPIGIHWRGGIRESKRWSARLDVVCTCTLLLNYHIQQPECDEATCEQCDSRKSCTHRYDIERCCRWALGVLH